MTAIQIMTVERITIAIRNVRALGGDVNRIATTETIRRALLKGEGGNPDSEFQIMGVPVVADPEMKPGHISLTWWEA